MIRSGVMRPVDRVLLLLCAACSRQPAAAGDGAPAQPAPVAGTSEVVTGAEPVPAPAAPPAADAGVPVALAPDEGLTRVEPLRPGPDEVDRALLLRMRRRFDAALKIEAIVRSGDAQLVAYTYNEIDAWWREVHRTGKADEVRAALKRRRLACEAAMRHPDEATDTGAADGDAIDDFDPGVDDAMDDRSCWERARASLAPREGPLDEECLALAVARVTADAIDPLWTLDGACVDAPAPAAFALVDVAGAGWPQLVVQVEARRWGMTRTGFQHADTSARLVVLDPRKASDAVMLEQVVSYHTIVDEAWRWEGSYADVEFKRGRHVTVLEQRWETTEECEHDAAGWAVPDAGDEEDQFAPCAVEWSHTRTPWDPATQRWSGKAEQLPRPKRLPQRDGELPIDVRGAR